MLNVTDMQNFILSPIAIPELVNLIACEVEARIHSVEKAEPLQDRISLYEAIQITGLQKSAIYKMTMASIIPHEKFGKRLVFSRKELLSWVEERITRKQSPDETVMKHLQKGAKKRLR